MGYITLFDAPLLSFILFIIFCFIIKKLFIALIYFIAVEKIYYENKKIYYKKILFKMFVVKRLSFSISEIKKISNLDKKILKSSSSLTNLIYYLYYFKIYERICIENMEGKKYYIWNWVKSPTVFSWNDNSDDNDDEFKEEFKKISEMINNEKNNYLNELNIKNKEEIYKLKIDERYKKILKKILEEEKVYILKEKGNLYINAMSVIMNNSKIFKNMNFQEKEFYKFYVDYLLIKENENKIMRVGYNGVDYKEISFGKFRDDINEYRR